MKPLIWTGAALAVLGGGVLLGYSAYNFGEQFFGADDVPVALLFALPVALTGLVILAASVLIERLRERAEEDFEEMDF
jgi:hypothetical protein